MTLDTEQRVGRDALARYRVLRAELDTQLADFRRITGNRTTTRR